MLLAGLSRGKLQCLRDIAEIFESFKNLKSIYIYIYIYIYIHEIKYKCMYAYLYTPMYLNSAQFFM